MASVELVVGQTLLFTREDRWSPNRNEGINKATALTVDSLGRKWAYCGGYKIHKRTLEVDAGDYHSPGRCYLSREHYAAEKAAERAWADLLNQTRRPRTSNGPSVDDIRKAATLLGIEIAPATDVPDEGEMPKTDATNNK